MSELTLESQEIAEALRKNIESYKPSVEREEVGRVMETGDGIAEEQRSRHPGINALDPVEAKELVRVWRAKEEHRLAVNPQIGGVVGVDAQGVAQHLDRTAGSARGEGAGHFHVQGQLEAASVGHVQHGGEVGLSLVIPRTIPANHEGVDACALRLCDVSVHGGRIAADVGLCGEVGDLGRGPGVFVKPSVVEGQDEPRALSAGADGGQQNTSCDDHEQKRCQQPPGICDAVRHLWKHGVIIPERHGERQR